MNPELERVTWRGHTLVEEDGTILLTGVPFRAGDIVEIIVAERCPRSSDAERYPLRGAVLRYDAPTEPVRRRRSNTSS